MLPRWGQGMLLVSRQHDSSESLDCRRAPSHYQPEIITPAYFDNACTKNHALNDYGQMNLSGALLKPQTGHCSAMCVS